MSRPRISDAKRKLWKAHPMMRVGVTFRPDQTRTIREMTERGDTLSAQQLILKLLSTEIDGPRTVARWRNGHKALCAAR